MTDPDRAPVDPSETAEPSAGEKLRWELYQLDGRSNRHARTAYTLGFLAIIPCIGLPAAFAAVIYGTLGLRKSYVSPQAGGGGQSMLAIGMGTVSIVLHVSIAAASFMGVNL